MSESAACQAHKLLGGSATTKSDREPKSALFVFQWSFERHILLHPRFASESPHVLSPFIYRLSNGLGNDEDPANRRGDLVRRMVFAHSPWHLERQRMQIIRHKPEGYEGCSLW